jgi:hypothetical protein
VKAKAKPARSVKLRAGTRNKFEESIATQLGDAGIDYGYETLKLPIEFAPRTGKYTPDFECRGSNIIIEGKGYFRKAADRQKLVLAKEQHPHLDIRIVFYDARKPIYKGSPTTYGKWATDHGFPWSDKGLVPAEWIKDMKRHPKAT